MAKKNKKISKKLYYALNNSVKKALIASGLAVSLSFGLTGSGFAVAPDEVPTVSAVDNATIINGPGYLGIQNDAGTGGTARVWHPTYNIGPNGLVDYIFPFASQTTISIINANAGISQIYGTIQSSGAGADSSSSKVVLTNPNGFYFDGANLINLNSLTVSTNDLIDMQGRSYTFRRTTPEGAPIIFNGETKIISDIPGIDTTFIASAIWMRKNAKIKNPKGKVQLITADGITIRYGKTGQIPKIKGNDPTLIPVTVDPKNIFGILTQLLNTNENIIINKSAAIEAKSTRVIAKRDHASNGEATIDIKGRVMANAATVGEDGSIYIYASNEHSDGAEVDISHAELNAGDKVSVEVASNKITASETVFEDNGGFVATDYFLGIPVKWEWNSDWDSTSSAAYIKAKNVTLRVDDFTDMSKVTYNPTTVCGIRLSGPNPVAPAVLPDIEAKKLVATRFQNMSTINDAELQRIVNLADSVKTIQLGDKKHLAPISGFTQLDLTGKNLWIHGTDTALNIGKVKHLKVKNGSADIELDKAASVKFSTDGTFNLAAGKIKGKLDVSGEGGTIDVNTVGDIITHGDENSTRGEAFVITANSSDDVYAYGNNDITVNNDAGDITAGYKAKVTAGTVRDDVNAYDNSTVNADNVLGNIFANADQGEKVTINVGTANKDIFTQNSGSYDITVNNSVRDIFGGGDLTLDVNDARFLVFNGGDLVIDRLNATAVYARGEQIIVKRLNHEFGYLQSDNFDFSGAEVQAKLLMLARFAREGKDKSFNFNEEGLSKLVMGSGDPTAGINNLVIGAPGITEAFNYISNTANSQGDPGAPAMPEFFDQDFILGAIAADSFFYDGDILAGNDAVVPTEYVDFSNVRDNLILLTKGDVDMKVSGVNSLTALFPHTLKVEANDELGINTIVTQYEASLAANSFRATPWPLLLNLGLINHASIFSMAGPVIMQSGTQPVDFISYNPDGFFGRGTSVITFGEEGSEQFFEITGNFGPADGEEDDDGNDFSSRELESQTKLGAISGYNRQIPEILNKTVPVVLRPAGAAASIEVEGEDEEEEEEE